jgi:hypothetical protein
VRATASTLTPSAPILAIKSLNSLCHSPKSLTNHKKKPNTLSSTLRSQTAVAQGPTNCIINAIRNLSGTLVKNHADITAEVSSSENAAGAVNQPVGTPKAPNTAAPCGPTVGATERTFLLSTASATPLQQTNNGEDQTISSSLAAISGFIPKGPYCQARAGDVTFNAVFDTCSFYNVLGSEIFKEVPAECYKHLKLKDRLTGAGGAVRL